MKKKTKKKTAKKYRIPLGERRRKADVKKRGCTIHPTETAEREMCFPS